MTLRSSPPNIELPKFWPDRVRTAMLHVISLAQYATAYTRSWAANAPLPRVRLKAENDRLKQEVSLLGEEIRIKDARMLKIPAHRRPHYSPTERLAILELRAARGWSQQKTAKAFHISLPTIATWMKRVNESGPNALLQLPVVVNRFPDFVAHAVVRLKRLCPQLGKVKIAQMLARAGLHLSPTTIGRMLKSPPQPPRKNRITRPSEPLEAAKPNDIWHIDLTAVPIGGFWTSWRPFALPQSWPFCRWVAVILDQYSRRVVGIGVYQQNPTSIEMRQLLGRTIQQTGAEPQTLISDKGSQFTADGFNGWCEKRSITPRFGALGKHNSIALIERFNGTLKREWMRRILVPLNRRKFRESLMAFIGWYNQHRPSESLDGKTPDEVYYSKRAANQKPRLEPRERWPRKSKCASPNTLVAGQPGDAFTIDVGCVGGNKHLPIVTLNRAA